VIGLRCRVGRNVTVRDSILMGQDYYGPGEATSGHPSLLGVGDGAVIEGAIIDKNCSIGRNVKIQPRDGLGPEGDFDNVVIRDGVIVVKKGAELRDGWSL
jgi:glucose-1-phosphate adenylyltransferase